MAEGPGDTEFDERSRQRDEARFRLSQAVAHIGNWEIDLASRMVWASDEAFHIYGFATNPRHCLPLSEVQTRPLLAYRAELDRAMQELVNHGAPYDVRFRVERADDGAVRLVHSMAQVLRDASGRPTIVAGTVQDITEREERHQRMVDALAASEERARLAFERAADAILIFDASGTLRHANERAVTLTGRPLDDLLGRNLRDLFSPAELSVRPFLAEVVEAGETVVAERRLLRADGSEVPVEMSSRLLADGLAQAIVRDVTERRRLEEQLQLRQRMDSLGTLAAGIAHDFNNILVGIMGFGDLLKSEAGLSPGQRELVEDILRASQRAADLVHGLNQLTRPEPSRGESFDLAEVVDEVCAVLRETTDRIVVKDNRVVRGQHFLHGKSSDLYHALMNLGVNAVQAVLEKGSPSGGFVRFEARAEAPRLPGRREPSPGRWVHLTVTDSGVGMTPEVRRQAFDPLFSTKERGRRGGQGLGLTMVYNIVIRQYGGAIDIDTEPGAGACFHLYLPGEERPAESTTAPVRMVAEPGRPLAATILVVDDEPHIVRLVRRVLRREGYQILSAHDGAEAVELFEQRPEGIDLVLLDRNMPSLSGEQVLSKLRALRADVRVVLSSGGGVSVPPGAMETLPKPYTATQLREVIRRALAGV